MRRRSTALLIGSLLALGTVAGSALAIPGGTGPNVGAEARNPCTGPGSGLLLCPDLRVGPAFDLYVERRGSGRGGSGGSYYAARASAGRVRLHAANDIRSRGRGPVELRGRRYKPNWMRANQAIHRVGGGALVMRTQMRLHYFDVGKRFGGSWWKVRDPLSMEIWTVDRDGGPQRRVRKGPKVHYCFRDLERTRPGRRSPKRRVYPACSQDPSLRRTKMGTSVGWSDIYPAEYDRQWVDVTGLRGCYAFVMRVDPENHIFESNEDNNRSTRLIRLPYRKGRPHRCR